jgi:hypothetical protein
MLHDVFLDVKPDEPDIDHAVSSHSCTSCRVPFACFSKERLSLYPLTFTYALRHEKSYSRVGFFPFFAAHDRPRTSFVVAFVCVSGNNKGGIAPFSKREDSSQDGTTRNKQSQIPRDSRRCHCTSKSRAKALEGADFTARSLHTTWQDQQNLKGISR